jgi:hypothetical protein
VESEVSGDLRHPVRQVTLAQGRKARSLEHVANFASGWAIDVGGIVRVGLGVDPTADGIVDHGEVNENYAPWLAQPFNGPDTRLWVGQVFDQVHGQNDIKGAVEGWAVE